MQSQQCLVPWTCKVNVVKSDNYDDGGGGDDFDYMVVIICDGGDDDCN